MLKWLLTVILLVAVFGASFYQDAVKHKKVTFLEGTLEVYWEGTIYPVSPTASSYKQLFTHLKQAYLQSDAVCKCASEPINNLLDRNAKGIVLKLRDPIQARMPSKGLHSQETTITTIAVRFTESNDSIAAGEDKLVAQYHTSHKEIAALKKEAESFVKGTELTNETVRNQFQIRVETDKKVYRKDEKILISATFAYIGSQKEMKIYHSANYIFFGIRNEKTGFTTNIAEDQPLLTTVLQKEKEYRFPYRKSGAYLDTDPDADFWRKFYADPDLHLPPGEYIVKAYASFSTDREKLQETELVIPVETIIQVTE